MLKPVRRPADDEDGQAFADAAAGDAAAFGSLVRCHQGMVFSLALRFLRDRAAAEDLAQEVFLELFKALPTLRSSDHLKYWLRRVTSHRCIDRVRRSARAHEVRLDETPEPVTEPAAADVFLDARIRDMVGRLPEPARLVVLLRYQEDLEPSEIAAVLDMPVNTVKSHLRRSVLALRDRLSGTTHGV